MMEYPDLQYIGRGIWMVKSNFKAPYGSEVHRGFTTDLMSSPKWASVFGIGNADEDMRACALVHDLEYSKESTVSRATADKNLLRNLRAYGVGYIRANVIYLSVRAFGDTHYKR